LVPARHLAEWKAKLRAAWGGVSLRRVDEPTRRIDYGGKLRIEVALRLNGLAPDDIALEVMLGRPGNERASQSARRERLAYQRPLPETGEHLYALEFAPSIAGRIEYRVRAYPSHELLTHPFEMGMMVWL
jgi:starch phosphorylase